MSVKGWIEANNYKGGIIRYLYDKVVALDSASGGDETDISALKTTVGDSSSGLVKDMADAKVAIGTDDTTEGSLKKRCKAIETAIGDEDTAASILGRIKALETAANTNQGQE